MNIFKSHGKVAHAFNLSNLEVEIDISLNVQGQPGADI